MTRKYFGMLFILLFSGIYIALTYFVPVQKLSDFIVIWVLCGFYVGQYSMKYPKD